MQRGSAISAVAGTLLIAVTVSASAICTSPLAKEEATSAAINKLTESVEQAYVQLLTESALQGSSFTSAPLVTASN